MNVDAEKLLNAVLALPADDREAIAELLLLSLDKRDANEIELAWEEEIKRRVREVKDGTATLVPWEQVRDGLLDRKRAAK